MHLTSRHLALVAGALIVLTAVATAEAISAIRLVQGATGPVHALPGQLIQVRLSYNGADMVSGDLSIVKPIAASNSSSTFYFVAGMPGRTFLRMAPRFACRLCLESLVMLWAVEVDVG